MIIKKSTFIAAMSTALISQFSFAGLVVNFPVTIVMQDEMSGWVQGDLASARHSDDNQTFIECSSQSYLNSEKELVTLGACAARDATGKFVSCYTYDEKLLREIESVSTHGEIVFQWNTNGLCTAIGSRKSSMYLDNNVAN